MASIRDGEQVGDVPVPSHLQQLAEQEPWRLGVGTPKNALDPTWTPGPHNNLCSGLIEWEAGTGWWTCQRCGYIGCARHTKHHAIEHPYTFLQKSVRMALSAWGGGKRSWEAVAYVAGVAVRYACHSKDLRGFIERIKE